MSNKKYKIPVILYESDEQNIPYIEVEKDDDMPPAIFIQEYKHTGEIEPDNSGAENPIVDITMHMYVNMGLLSKNLTPELYDEVRIASGLKPLREAKEEGQKILEKVYENVNNNMASILPEKASLKDDLIKNVNERLSEKFYKTQEQNTNKVKLQYDILNDDNDKEKE